VDSPDRQEAAECGDQSLFALERVMYLRSVIAASLSGIVCLGASFSAASARDTTGPDFPFGPAVVGTN